MIIARKRLLQPTCKRHGLFKPHTYSSLWHAGADHGLNQLVRSVSIFLLTLLVPLCIMWVPINRFHGCPHLFRNPRFPRETTNRGATLHHWYTYIYTSHAHLMQLEKPNQLHESSVIMHMMFLIGIYMSRKNTLRFIIATTRGGGSGSYESCPGCHFDNLWFWVWWS